MKGFVLVEPGRLELRELEMPEPDPGGVVVRVETALTCGTDLKTFRRGHPKFTLPMRFGHEFSGTIVAAGTDVRGFGEGDAVMLAPTGPCGTCYFCLREQENLCTQVIGKMVFGAYAEYVHVPAHVMQVNVFHKPDSLPFAEAALLEPLACVVHGLSEVHVRPDDHVVVIGAGAFALLHVLLLRARGVERILGITRGASRAEALRAAGACQVRTGGVEGSSQEVLDWTEGRGADLVVECTGQPEVWNAAPDLARVGGRVILFGGCASGTTLTLSTARLHYDQVRISSPFHFTPRAVREARTQLCDRKIAMDSLFSGTFPLEDLPLAIDRLQNGQGAKYIIVPHARSVASDLRTGTP